MSGSTFVCAMSRHGLPGAPRSKRAPFIGGEDPGERHARRKRIAIEDVHRMGDELASVPTAIETYNDGAHWKITRRGVVFEWWPETGRLVINQQWSKARKAHDVDQVVAVVRKMSRRAR